jgi:hypothetical protein
MAVVGEVAGPKVAVSADRNKLDRCQRTTERGWKDADVTGGMLEVEIEQWELADG